MTDENHAWFKYLKKQGLTSDMIHFMDSIISENAKGEATNKNILCLCVLDEMEYLEKEVSICGFHRDLIRIVLSYMLTWNTERKNSKYINPIYIGPTCSFGAILQYCYGVKPNICHIVWENDDNTEDHKVMVLGRIFTLEGEQIDNYLGRWNGLISDEIRQTLLKSKKLDPFLKLCL